MEWIEVSKERPPFGEFIWVWDMRNQKAFLIKYFGTHENWEISKNHKTYPLWKRAMEPPK